MKTLENIKQEHRNRIIKHICHIVFRNEASSDDVNKINIMITLGKTIPEVISSLRRVNDDHKTIPIDVNSISAVVNAYSSVNGNDRNSLRTPLETHFHRYADV